MNKTDLVANLYIGFQNGYITKDEYLDMVNLIPQFNQLDFEKVYERELELNDSYSLDKEMALESENIEF